ncbi:MAG: hypothetical protein R3E39_15635 [Anaerolineae bacterium]
MNPELDYHALYKQVATEMKQRKFRARLLFLSVYASVYLLFVMIAAVLLRNGHRDVQFAAGGTPHGLLDSLSMITGALFLLGFVGFFGLLFQAVSLYLDTRKGEDSMRERLLSRAIARQMHKADTDEYEQKTKRKRSYSLIDDAEVNRDMEEEVRWVESLPAEQHHRHS